MTRSCSDGPRAAGFCTMTWLPTTIGADRPPYGTRQRKFSPLMAHFSGSPVSREMPSRLGPRASGQSPTGTRRGPWAETSRPALTTRAPRSDVFFSIIMATPLILPSLPAVLQYSTPAASESHARAHPEGARGSVLPDEPRRCEARIGERDWNVARVERIAHPDLAEGMAAAQARAQVRQRVGLLAGGVRII